MMQNRTIILILIVLALIVSYALDFPNELVNFSVAAGILGYELYEDWKFRQFTKSSTTFQLKSYEWLWGLGVSGFILYSFSDEPMNLWNICAILEILIFSALYTLRNRTLTYTIEDSGIRNLFNGKILESSTITDIKFNNEQLAIDTTKYQNDLIVKSPDLKSPSWDELTNELTKLNKNVGE